MAPIDTFPNFNRQFQIDIVSSQLGVGLLVTGSDWKIPNDIVPNFEFLFRVNLQYLDSNHTTRFRRDPIKSEIVVANSRWHLEALWGVFIEHLRIFREPLDQMPLLMNHHDELTRHFVSWRLENGI